MCDDTLKIPATIPKSTLLRLKADYESKCVSNKEASETLADIQRKVLRAAALGESHEIYQCPTRVINAILPHIYTMLPGCAINTCSMKTFPIIGENEPRTHMTISWA
jgi:hypothetical protein